VKHLAALMLIFALTSMSGCVRYKYRAAPLSAPVIAQALESRNLDDPALRDWMQRNGGFDGSEWPLQNWNLQALTLAAFYFSPDLDVARANANSAEAAITTASAKPNPSVSLGPGYQTPNPSQFITSFDFSIPIETAGKRGYRVAAATHLSEASRLQLGQTAWVVRSRVRAALVEYLFAEEAADLLRKEEGLRESYAGLIERRTAVGEAAVPDLTAARIEQTAGRQALRTAEGAERIARVALAEAIGIPESGLESKTFRWPDWNTPPAPASLPAQSMRSAAVRNRLDVERGLAQYQAAEANLQLEVARQYPDLNLGPAYAYEEGSNFISLSLSTVLPIRNHNEGPIAEAEAQRKAAGAQLLAVQSTVIAETDRALSEYVAASATAEEAARSVAELQKQQQSAQRLLDTGEGDRLGLIAAQLQTSVAERAGLDALRQAQVALGSLESALQRPISPAATQPLPASAPRRPGEP
jgi:cobalt-zinc-cadmium efflux system outer membrane protein